jgi:hypothetical protein
VVDPCSASTFAGFDELSPLMVSALVYWIGEDDPFCEAVLTRVAVAERPY